jgi:hypothetical protein
MIKGLLMGVTLDELGADVVPVVVPVIEAAVVEVPVVEAPLDVVLVDVGVPVPRT